MGMDYFAMKKGIKGSASGEEESESEFVWRAAFEEHLGVEREALARLVLRGVGFDEFVIEKDGGVRTLIEHFVGIRDVRDSEELYYETFRVIYAFFKGKHKQVHHYSQQKLDHPRLYFTATLSV
ncbi:hypothetical protein D5086_005113 [Populus alba]|uniref:Uncharacterized protein n=1 Tax=Populus alba TaxID=43335 RepID=A0ACC4CSF1_POPAL